MVWVIWAISVLHMVWFIRAISNLRMVWFIWAISVLRVVWFILAFSVQTISLYGHTTLHYDCFIFADFMKHRMTGMSNFGGYPQYHDSNPCMYSYSRISNLCLLGAARKI